MLIAQRISWLVASQSFLFSGYAIVMGRQNPDYVAQQKVLFFLVPLVGAFTCLLIYFTIIAAVLASGHLRQLYRAQVPEKLREDMPPLQSSPLHRWLGLIAPLVMPIIFVITWLTLLIHGLSIVPIL